MAKTVVIGCDKNNGSDAKWQNGVAKVFKQMGFGIKKLKIHPTPFGSYGYTSAAKGKIGIYLMAASLTSVVDVMSSGWKFEKTFFIIRSDASRTIKSEEAFNSRGIPKDWHEDCRGHYCNKWAGKTYPQINKEIAKKKAKVVFGSNPTAAANQILAELEGTVISSSGGKQETLTENTNASPLLQGEMTFQELVGEVCNGIDLMFLCKRSTVVVTDFETIFAEAKYLRDNHHSAVSNEDVKLWQLEDDSYELDINQHGFYNTVYVRYNKGLVRESFDDLVKVYGEVPITYNDPKIDKSTAIMKAKAYLAAHLRDLEMTINATILSEPDIDIGDIVTLDNPKTMQNTRKKEEGYTPEYLFVKGVNTSWDGDGYIESDLEMQFSPTSPEKKEVPTHGTKSCGSKTSKSSGGDMVFDSCGVSQDNKYVLSISQPSAGRMGSYSYNKTYATVFVNKCPRCGKATLRWDSGLSGAKCITCGGYHGSKSSWGNISESEVTCNSCCSDFCGTTGWEKDGSYSSRLSTYKQPVLSSKDEKYKLAKGGYSL